MEENPKKGSRDISDLKARLGLKKGATTGAQQTASPNPNAAQGAGTARAPQAIPAPVPPPPGFARPAEPEPAAPPPPDPRRDPFAAASQPMVPQAYYMPLPGSDDGTAAAPMSKPKPWGRIAGGAVVALLVFIVGNACGRIYQSRVNFNTTIDQSGEIQTEVKKMAAALKTITDTLNQAAKDGPARPDVELATNLGTLNLKKPDTSKLFHTNYFYLKDLAIERLFTYYNDTVLLYDLIEKNAKKTEADKEAIQAFNKNTGGKENKNYAVTLDTSGPIPLAHFVELGPPVCPKADQTDCSSKELKGFRYRSNSGAQWQEKPIKGANPILPIAPEDFFRTVASGSPDILAVKDHLRRTAEIRMLTQKLFTAQKDVLSELQQSMDRPKVFTF